MVLFFTSWCSSFLSRLEVDASLYNRGKCFMTCFILHSMMDLGFDKLCIIFINGFYVLLEVIVIVHDGTMGTLEVCKVFAR